MIILSEIPYEVVKSSLVKKISDIYLSKEIDGIVDVRDESGRNEKVKKRTGIFQ